MTRVWPPGDHTRLKIWYNPCIIRQYIHGKTDENHVLLSNNSTAISLQNNNKSTFIYSCMCFHKTEWMGACYQEMCGTLKE